MVKTQKLHSIRLEGRTKVMGELQKVAPLYPEEVAVLAGVIAEFERGLMDKGVIVYARESDGAQRTYNLYSSVGAEQIIIVADMEWAILSRSMSESANDIHCFPNHIVLELCATKGRFFACIRASDAGREESTRVLVAVAEVLAYLRSNDKVLQDAVRYLLLNEGMTDRREVVDLFKRNTLAVIKAWRRWCAVDDHYRRQNYFYVPREYVEAFSFEDFHVACPVLIDEKTGEEIRCVANEFDGRTTCKGCPADETGICELQKSVLGQKADKAIVEYDFCTVYRSCSCGDCPHLPANTLGTDKSTPERDALLRAVSSYRQYGFIGGRVPSGGCPR